MSYILDDENCPPGIAAIFARSPTALSLASETLADRPLVAINESFCKATGYTSDDVLGRNCRFLQPPGGAGPVRGRIRSFLDDDDVGEQRFVIPNVTKYGDSFLNIVYMAKIRHPRLGGYVLGSQFALRTGGERAAAYERALREDLTSLSDILSESDWMLLGSMQAIANTSALVARHKIEG
ncbi:MAG: PAS domain-containing protein [Sphingomonas bacterium]|nr:PAS domain-containing protein [Sphingomonas bacterium]